MTERETVAAALAHAARSDRGLTTIEHDGLTTDLPFGQLFQRALTGGGRLVADGLRPGDRVALVVPDVSAFIEAFFAVQAAGLVPVPLVPAGAGRRRRHLCPPDASAPGGQPGRRGVDDEGRRAPARPDRHCAGAAHPLRRDARLRSGARGASRGRARRRRPAPVHVGIDGRAQGRRAVASRTC